MHLELHKVLPLRRALVECNSDPIAQIDLAAAVQVRVEQLTTLKDLDKRDHAVKEEYKDRFPGDIPHCNTLPDDILFQVRPKDASKIIQLWSYDCPKKYKDAWHTLLQQHIAAGQLCPLSSEHSSPAFIILKADPTVLPHWVNNFRVLNTNTVADNHPLPRIDEILRDCAKG